MNRLNALIIGLFAAFIFAAFSCKANDPTVSRSDGDAESGAEEAEITYEQVDEAEIEPDATQIEESEPEAADEEIMEEEARAEEETIAEEEEHAAEFDEEIEFDEAILYDREPVDENVETAEKLTISYRGFPWPGVEITTCPDTNANWDLYYKTAAVWDDDDGTAYFGGPNFWKFTDSPTEKAVCDARVTDFTIDIIGRLTELGYEIWTAHNAKIARLLNDEWTTYYLPQTLLTETDDKSKNDVQSIGFWGDYLFILTKEKVGALYVPGQEWNVVTNCPDNLDRTFGLKWDGKTLWASAGFVLYRMAWTNFTCAPYSEVPHPDGGNHAGILNADDEGALWIAVADRTVKTLLRFKYDVYERVEMPISENAKYAAIGQGMGGWPLMYFETDYWFYEIATYCPTPPPYPSPGCEEHSRMLLVDQTGALLGDAWGFDGFRTCTWTSSQCTFPPTYLAETLLNQRRIFKTNKRIWAYFRGNAFNASMLGLTEITIK